MSEETNISNISEDSGKNLLSKGDILNRKHFLIGKMIGISISESDNLTELGYSVAHLKDTIIEIARYIMAVGGKVAYGGDMRQGGFTELLFDLLAYYKADKELQPSERFHSYLAYPITTTLTMEKEAELRQNVTFVRVFPPNEVLINRNEFLKPNTAENLYVWSRSLSEMRQTMERECHARILIGGRSMGYKGKYPGILEEFLLALELKHPIFLVGAFGGITNDIIKALHGNPSDSISDEFHLKNNEYSDFLALFNRKHPHNKIDYSETYSTIKSLGFRGLSELNGLSLQDNLRLANTPHIAEIVFLIMKGLSSYFVKKKDDL